MLRPSLPVRLEEDCGAKGVNEEKFPSLEELDRIVQSPMVPNVVDDAACYLPEHCDDFYEGFEALRRPKRSFSGATPLSWCDHCSHCFLTSDVSFVAL